MGFKWTDRDAQEYKKMYGEYPDGYQPSKGPAPKTPTPSRTPAKDEAENFLYQSLLNIAKGQGSRSDSTAVDVIGKGQYLKGAKDKKTGASVAERRMTADKDLIDLINKKAELAKTGYRNEDGEPELGYGDLSQQEYEAAAGALDRQIKNAQKTSDKLSGSWMPPESPEAKRYLDQPGGFSFSDRLKSILGIDPNYQGPGPEYQAPADLYIQTVRSPDDYAKLAPGAEYYDPKGVKRRKAGAQ